MMPVFNNNIKLNFEMEVSVLWDMILSLESEELGLNCSPVTCWQCKPGKSTLTLYAFKFLIYKMG